MSPSIWSRQPISLVLIWAGQDFLFALLLNRSDTLPLQQLTRTMGSFFSRKKLNLWYIIHWLSRVHSLYRMKFRTDCLAIPWSFCLLFIHHTFSYLQNCFVKMAMNHWVTFDQLGFSLASVSSSSPCLFFQFFRLLSDSLLIDYKTSGHGGHFPFCFTARSSCHLLFSSLY